jgi:hypothetical protein
MRKLLLLLSILLLGACWAVAQDSSSPSNTGSGSSSTGSSQSTSGSSQTESAASSGQTGSTSATGRMTVEGCLSGSSGNYTLSDKKGNTYQLTGDTAKLSEHVGHEVKITGNSSSGSASAGGTATGSAGANSQTLEVSSVKHISKTCQNAGGMSK